MLAHGCMAAWLHGSTACHATACHATLLTQSMHTHVRTKQGYCCGQTGVCSRSADACDGTCQCAFSGVGSACKGSFPFAAPLRLPTAARNGLCGPYTANCPQGQCCSQFSICVDSISPYCQSRSCVHGGSAFSQQCNNMHSGSSPGIVRATWVVTWKNLSLDGYTRPVRVASQAAGTRRTCKLHAQQQLELRVTCARKLQGVQLAANAGVDACALRTGRLCLAGDRGQRGAVAHAARQCG